MTEFGMLLDDMLRYHQVITTVLSNGQAGDCLTEVICGWRCSIDGCDKRVQRILALDSLEYAIEHVATCHRDLQTLAAD